MNEEEPIKGTEKEFIKQYESLTRTRSAWEVWADLMEVWAIALSNVADPDKKRWQEREDQYLRTIKKFDDPQAVAKLFSILTIALEKNPAQDFLGKIYMNLGLGDHWKGQFFTPYTLCQMMAEMTIDQQVMKARIEEHGWIAVSDPACGAGATLIAAAETIRRMHINYQQRVLFIGGDIDRVTAQMCYIQLTLLGCAGYVAIADTLTNPLEGDVLFPKEKEDQDLWFTPELYGEIWTGRRFARYIDLSLRKRRPKTDNVFYFDFDKREIRKEA